MEMLDVIFARRSIRKYRPEAVAEADLDRILEAGRQSPSGGNRQPWHFVVVKDAEVRQELATACNGQLWLATAPIIIAALGKPDISRWHIVDPAIALHTMILAAHSYGYGTCWIGAFDAARVRSLLAIPDDYSLLALTPIGIPDEQPAARPRKARNEIFSANRFGTRYSDPVE